MFGEKMRKLRKKQIDKITLMQDKKYKREEEMKKFSKKVLNIYLSGIVFVFGIIFTVGKLNPSLKSIEYQYLKKNPTKQEIEDIFLTAQLNFKKYPEQSKKMLDEVIRYKPEASTYLANYYLEKGDNKNFEKWNLYGRQHNLIEAEYNLGVYYEQYRHNQKKAIEVYENILKKFEQSKVEHPSILMAINNLANIYAKRNKKVEAERLYKELEEKNDRDGIYNFAFFRRREGKYEEAEKLYKKAMNLGVPNAYKALAEMYEDLGRNSEAKALYDKEVKNGDTKAMFILGMKYSDENNFEKAKKMFDMILQKDPKYTDALIEIGMLYKNQKNYKEAEKYYKKAISIKKNARYLTNLGVVYMLQLEENKAEKLYKEAIQMGGDGSEAAIYNLGILYYSNKRYKEAKKLLEEAANKGNLKAKEFLKEMEKTNE